VIGSASFIIVAYYVATFGINSVFKLDFELQNNQ